MYPRTVFQIEVGRAGAIGPVRSIVTEPVFGRLTGDRGSETPESYLNVHTRESYLNVRTRWPATPAPR